jgi:serine/threonine protein kinase
MRGGAVDLIGTRIGSYVVERQLGSGGAGTVYACRHTMIDREVAVKFLHDEHVRDPDQVARFLQEAKAAAEIGHPNIIVIIDYGTLELTGGARTYVMMESLEGESLDKRMRRGGLSSDDILTSSARSPRPWPPATARASSIATSSPRTSSCAIAASIRCSSRCSTSAPQS